METKFQTSFIPKRPMPPVGGASTPAPHHHTASLFMTLSVIIFILSIGSVGAVYAWQKYLKTTQDTDKQQLAKKEKQFDVNSIEQYKQANIQITLAKDLLNKHLALSQVFDIISHITIENVRFTSMDLSSGGANASDGIKITMRGYGSNLSSVAFQSDVLAKLEKYGLRKVIKNPILSDPTLESNGTVAFGFSAVIDPGTLSYKTAVATMASSTATTSDSTSNTQ